MNHTELTEIIRETANGYPLSLYSTRSVPAKKFNVPNWPNTTIPYSQILAHSLNCLTTILSSVFFYSSRYVPKVAKEEYMRSV